MSILKLEIRLSEIAPTLEAFRKNRKAALEAISSVMRSAISTTINELMKAEIDVFLGQPDQSDNKRKRSSSTPESTSTVQAENVSVRLEGKHKIPVFELGNWTSSIYIASSASNHLEGARPAILKQIVVPNNGFKKTAVPGTYKVQLKKGQFLHIGSYDAFFDIGTGYLRENWLQEVIEIKNDELLVRSANTLVGTNTQDTPLNVGKQSSVLSTFGAAGVVTYRYLGKQTIEVTIPNYTAPLEF